MSFIITLLAAVFVFSAVIAIHEFGHFAVAKLCGVQVNEFSIGMGPVLLKKTQNGTQYSLRALGCCCIIYINRILSLQKREIFSVITGCHCSSPL